MNSTPTHAQSVARLARAKELFLDAIKLEAPDRKAFVHQACEGDESLRALVLELLAGAAMPLPIETLAEDIRVAASSIGDAPSTEPPGTMIGRYKLAERLGEGGFGVVFAADQVDPVKRRVALKLIKLGMDTRQVVARFEAERQALAMMEHPCIAKVFDAGATDTGRPYFVMELVQGRPLTQYCDENSLSLHERLALVMQVCDAVQHAHNRGIIHRDLKPSNILVANSESGPLPKVIDFGIAKATSGALTDKTVHTQVRQMIGTPEYMSPEQASGSIVDIDNRTDVYSLGVVLYELLVGVTPFDSQRLRTAAHGEVQRIIREEDPPRPSARLSRQIRKDSVEAKLLSTTPATGEQPQRLPSLLRGDLDWIVMKAIEKDRERRYDSPASLSRDIARYLSGEAVHAAPPSRIYKARKFVRRNWFAVAAVGTISASLVVGAVGFAWQARLAGEQRDAALAAQKRAENTTDFIAAVLQSSHPNTPGGGESTTVLEAMQKAITDMDAGRFKDDPQTDASLRKTIGGVLESFGRIESARSLYEQSLKTLQAQHAGDHPLVAQAMSKLAYMEYASFRYDKSNQLAESALAMAQRLYKGDHQDLTQALTMVAILQTKDNPERSLDLFRQSLAMERRLYPDGSDGAVYGLWNIGRLETALGRTEQAERTLREALALSERRRAQSPIVLSLALAHVGAFRRDQGDLAEAEHYLTEAIVVYDGLVSQPTWDWSSHRRELAKVKVEQGKAADAERLCNEAMQYQAPPGSPLIASILSTRARARMLLGRTEDARTDFEQSLAIARSGSPGDHGRLLAELLLQSARAHLSQGDVPTALRELQEASALAEQAPVMQPRVAAQIQAALLEATQAASAKR